jgi:FeS assembly protein IscX
MTLTWETSYAIALELKRQRPELDLAEVSLQQIYDWTLKLEDFEDDPALCNDDILAAIYQEWLEESLNDGKSGT